MLIDIWTVHQLEITSIFPTPTPTKWFVRPPFLWKKAGRERHWAKLWIFSQLLEHNLNSVWFGTVESTLDETQWIWWSWYVLINHWTAFHTLQKTNLEAQFVPLGSPHWGRHWERPGKMTVPLEGINAIISCEQKVFKMFQNQSNWCKQLERFSSSFVIFAYHQVLSSKLRNKVLGNEISTNCKSIFYSES